MIGVSSKGIANFRALFFSDLHLESDEDPKALYFTSWIAREVNNFQEKSRPDLTHLFLMGDVFDMWVADHAYFQQKYARVIETLMKLKKKGVEIHYFEGNHDLYLKKFFSNQLGFSVHSSPIFYQLGDRNLRLEHGDQMDPSDSGYIFLRWLLRTPVLRLLALNLPGLAVKSIGEWASAKSRAYTSQKKTIDSNTAREVVRVHAEKIYGAREFDLMVCGHVHVPMDFFLSNGKSQVVNLGGWIASAVALEVTQEAIATFPIIISVTQPD